MGEVSVETSYLYANPSFFGGMAKILDMGGTLMIYNESRTPVEADMKAISNDWKAVGNDLAHSIQEHEKKKK